MTRFCGCIGPRPYEDTISSLNEALRRAIRPPRAHKPKPDKLQEMQNCTTGSAHGQLRTGKDRSFMRRRCWEAQLRRVALDAKNAIAASGRCSRAAHFDRLVLVVLVVLKRPIPAGSASEALSAADHLLFRFLAIKCSGLLGADLQHTMRRRASVEMGRGSLRVQCTPGAGSPARG